MTRYQTAVELVGEYGIPVFPCAPNKQPRTMHGFKDASSCLDKIDEWFLDSDSLIGVPTGSRFFVVDIDPGGTDWYTANAERLACGCVNKTRRGWHLAYQVPAGVVIPNSTGKIAAGVDVRGTGGYVIWWPGEGLASTGTLADIGPPPQWLLDLILAEPKKGNGKDHANADDRADAIPAGQRNSSLTKLAGKLRRAGLSQSEIEAALLAANRDRCRPPLSDIEVQRIAQSVAKYQPGEDAQEPAPIAFDAINIPSLADVSATTVPPRTWFFEQIIPAGAFLIVGRPKIGKSWLLLQLAIATARRQSFLGYQNLDHHHD